MSSTIGPSAPNPASPDGLITIYGTTTCSECHLARRIFDQQGVQYDFIDIDSDPSAVDEVLKRNRGRRSVPTIVFPDGSVLVEPSRRELLAAL